MIIVTLVIKKCIIIKKCHCSDLLVGEAYNCYNSSPLEENLL